MRIVVRAALASVYLAVLCTSCTRRKYPDLVPENTGSNGDGGVKLEFFNKVGNANLVLDNGTSASNWYINANGDSFCVTTLNYYISNVKLLRSAGMYVEPESYHLLKQSDESSKTFDIAGVPQGQYTGVTFLVGVDSLRNVSGAQTGALDPANGMFWDWNTGYIMWKFEGRSPKSPQADKQVVFHGGGYSGQYKAMREVTLMFSTPITVTATTVNHVHINSDLLQLFKSPNLIDFSIVCRATMPGEASKSLSDNIANMFSVTYAGL